MKKPVVLRIFKGDQLLGVKQFMDSQIVFGRPGDVQVPLEGETVSVIHAAIEDRDGSYFIADLGSESGTLKNGERVLDAAIESGDIIQLGEYRIEFYIGVPKPKAPPVTAPGASPSTATVAQAIATPTAPVNETPAVPAARPLEAPVAAPAAKQTATPADPFEPVAVPEDAPGAKTPKRTEKRAEPAPIVPPSAQPSFNLGGGLGGNLAGARAKSSSQATSARGPQVERVESTHGKKKKTFAPPSHNTSIKEVIKPSKGTVVEIVVAWRERVIATYHFSEKKTVTIGSHPDCDVSLPLLSGRNRKIPIVSIGNTASIIISPEMTGELVRGQTSSSFVELLRQNRMVKAGAFYAIALEQGEMARVDFGDQVSVIVRYVSDSPKPLAAPFFDLSAAEFTGIVLACVLIAILKLYMFLYTPPKALDDDAINEPNRIAVIITPPTPKPKEPPAPPTVAKVEPTPPPTPQPVTRATPSPVKVPEQAKAKAQTSTNLTTKNNPGESANAAPNKNKTGPRALTSPKQGGSIKTADKEGSQMKSASRDVTHSGVFSVFGNKGANKDLSQSTSGSGELAGLANAATGKSGYGENRAGEGLGSDVKDTGRGGTGNALVGINGGVGTKGRGSGNSGYGDGGLGNKAGTRIVTAGGAGEAFSGSIDREAIRRVILANLKVIRTCYNRQLERNPDLLGKLVLSWDIGEGGRVLAARVKSNELGNPQVAECIMDRLKTWKFPEPPSNQVVVVEAYPFVFSN